MKFQELSLNSQFTIGEDTDKVYTKIKKRGATCCTPEHNAFYTEGKNKRNVLLVDSEQEVILVNQPEQQTETNKPQKVEGGGKFGSKQNEVT